MTLTWLPCANGFRAKTREFTLRVRSPDDVWLWTVHRRGGVPGGSRLEAHGRCSTQVAAAAAAERAVFCVCGETSTRNCHIHQNVTDHEAAVIEQPCSVYFCGADSTGKSALVKYVEKTYSMRKVPETARSVLHEEGFTLLSLRVRSADADAYQHMVFDRQIAQERATQRPFVADRGLDNLAYASEYGRCFAELAARQDVREYVEAQKRDVVFLVRPQRALRTEDGVRVLPSWEEQQRLDAKIELLLQLWDVPRVVIAESSASRREELIDWCLAARGFVKHG